MPFRVSSVRFKFEGAGKFQPPAGGETDLFRGALGAELRSSSEIYGRWFDPRWPDGPSGLRDAPRPFVLSWAGAEDSKSDVFALELTLFETVPLLEVIEPAMKAAIERRTGASRIWIEHKTSVLDLPFEKPQPGECDRLRLHFLTPIELKSSGKVLCEPDFPVLIERLAERVWALGRLYQHWRPDFDVRPWLETAKGVRRTDWEWHRSDWHRRSARSGAVHSVGGYTGWADYEGSLGAIVPLLEIGRWTGVGRQTVWGKGRIEISR